MKPFREHTDNNTPDYHEFLRRMYHPPMPKESPTWREWTAIVLFLAAFWAAAITLAVLAR